MRFAEVFLRLGSALVAWMVQYAYFLWLAAAYVVGCGPDGDEMYRLLLGMAPFAAASAFALDVTRPFGDTHNLLRWLAMPLILLLPFCLRTVWVVFRSVNLDGTALCGDGDPATWQLLWGAVQLAALCAITVLLVRVRKKVVEAPST